ncbi:hypothetical protein OHA25_61065 (plasmid) [Nonomuraea sp. NBC_00507]|uniref:hypothetical protein n=1 Tax=Nonomuraea sp. NBC_00507 TaxID=2976002 RepID=UPI002E17854F
MPVALHGELVGEQRLGGYEYLGDYLVDVLADRRNPLAWTADSRLRGLVEDAAEDAGVSVAGFVELVVAQVLGHTLDPALEEAADPTAGFVGGSGQQLLPLTNVA